MLNELVTPGVLQPTPHKKNLIPRFKARTGKGKTNVITFRRSVITRKITRLQILNHTGIQGYMVQSNPIQPRLNPKGEIDEGNGEMARK